MRPGPILVVEDGVDEGDLIVSAIQKAELPNPIKTLRSVDQFISYLKDLEATTTGPFEFPALVLLDLSLPARSGFEALEWVRASPQFRQVPVVVFTSSRQPEDVDKAYASGANSYLVKPSRFSELVELLKHTVKYWVRYNLSGKS